MTRASVILLVMAACGSSGPSEFTPYEPDPGTPERVAWDLGLTRHLGTAAPTATTPFGGGLTVFEFDPADGPICMRGAPYSASVRETGSDDLLIFLQGGGACWSDFCLAVIAAVAEIPPVDLLRDEPDNPLGGWDVLYLPYCDGSLFAGDNELDEDGDGAPDRIHHGLHNLSAALTAGYPYFPRPRRIVLAGSSGGGFGTILASALVRYVYPGVPLYVVDDAGIGIAKPGDPAFVEQLLDEFGARGVIPPDCPSCLGDGHITGLIDYLLAHDPELRFAAVSSWYDLVISDIFLQIPADTFRDAVADETDALQAAYPDRYRRFLYDGAAHTALLGDFTGIIGNDLGAVEYPPELFDRIADIDLASMYTLAIEDTTLAAWIGDMVDEDPAWRDLVQPAGPVPVP